MAPERNDQIAAEPYTKRGGYRFGVDPHLLEALGRITYNSSYLEGVSRVLFWRLLGSGAEMGTRVTADAPFQWLLDHIGVLADLRLPAPSAAEFRSWVNEARAAWTERNRIVHSDWYVDATTAAFRWGQRRETARGRAFKAEERLWTATELHAVGVHLESAGLEALRLMQLAEPVTGTLDSPIPPEPPRRPHGGSTDADRSGRGG